ncbi:MAG: response regulator [Magnetococcales bacterium]|nr:response regulator [Magnetococcales bacterium]
MEWKNKPIKGADKIRILFVEDEKSIHEKVLPMLRELGFISITTALDGDSAYLTFAGKPNDFELVITDFSMPGMDGVTLMQKISRINPRQYFLILTSHVQSEQVKSIFFGNRYVFLVGKNDIHTDRLVSLQRTLELICVHIHNSQSE